MTKDPPSIIERKVQLPPELHEEVMDQIRHHNRRARRVGTDEYGKQNLNKAVVEGLRFWLEKEKANEQI